MAWRASSGCGVRGEEPTLARDRSNESLLIGKTPIGRVFLDVVRLREAKLVAEPPLQQLFRFNTRRFVVHVEGTFADASTLLPGAGKQPRELIGQE